MKLEARVWVAILTYWIRLHFFPKGLAPLIRKDDFKSKWEGAIISKILSLGLSQDLLFTMKYDQTKAVIKQRVTDSERQLDIASSPAFIVNNSC
ncbi:hypothetical protein JRQ81_019487, partial [Phrynocephalus forsythii]